MPCLSAFLADTTAWLGSQEGQDPNPGPTTHSMCDVAVTEAC